MNFFNKTNLLYSLKKNKIIREQQWWWRCHCIFQKKWRNSSISNTLLDCLAFLSPYQMPPVLTKHPTTTKEGLEREKGKETEEKRKMYSVWSNNHHGIVIFKQIRVADVWFCRHSIEILFDEMISQCSAHCKSVDSVLARVDFQSFVPQSLLLFRRTHFVILTQRNRFSVATAEQREAWLAKREWKEEQMERKRRTNQRKAVESPTFADWMYLCSPIFQTITLVAVAPSISYSSNCWSTFRNVALSKLCRSGQTGRSSNSSSKTCAGRE